MGAKIIYHMSWTISTFLCLKVEIFGQETRDTFHISIERCFRRTLTNILIFVKVSTIGAELAILNTNIEILVFRARSASIHDKQRLILRASPALLILGIVDKVLLTILTCLISIIKEFRQETANAGCIGFERVCCWANTLLNLRIKLLPLEAADTLLGFKVKVFGWRASNAFSITDLIREIIFTFTLIIKCMILSSFIAFLASLISFIPICFSWTNIASVSVIKGICGRTGLALAGIQVIGLIICAGFACESGEIKEMRVRALKACFIVPKICLILEAVTLFRSGIVLPSLTTNKTQFFCLAIEVSLLALIAFIIVLELFVRGTIACQCFIIEYTASRARLT